MVDLIQNYNLIHPIDSNSHVSLRGKYFHKSMKETRQIEFSVLQVRREEMGLSTIREKDLEGTPHSDVYFVR